MEADNSNRLTETLQSNDEESDAVSSEASSISGLAMLRPRLFTLEDQIRMWHGRVNEAMEDIAYLEHVQHEGAIRVEDLNIDLTPAINNQRRANKSLNRAVTKILRARSRSNSEGLRRSRGRRPAHMGPPLPRPPLPLSSPPPPPSSPSSDLPNTGARVSDLHELHYD